MFSKALDALAGALEISHAVRLINYETNVNVSAIDVAKAVSRSKGATSSEDRAVLDVFLLALSLKRSFDHSRSVIADVLPRLRQIALKDGFLPRQKAVLDSSLPYVVDTWDFNKRLLKILRQATRQGYDVSSIVREMPLAESELRYALDEDKTDLQEIFARIFWPWR